MKIDPWASLEVKDYDSVMKEFGVDPIGSLYKKLPLKHHYFSRGIIFGHKDFQKIVEAVLEKKPFAMMTGLMPSGKFHFGHKIVADTIIFLQKLGAECYVAVADIEATLTRNVSREQAREIAIDQYLVNYIALGLDSKKTKFYFQSNGSVEYNNLSKYVSKRTTLNELKSIYGDLTPEKMMCVFTQIADILHPQLKENGGPKPVVVPVGLDQLPHINITRDVATKMKSEYGFIPPAAIFNKLLPGLQGGKMSSSKPESYIALTESPEEAKMKIMKYAFSGGRDTIKEHREKGGNPDVDVSYQYLTYFEEDDKKLEKIYNDYKSGALLTGELKQILIDKLTKFLKHHQAEREKAKKKIDKFILKD
jgi:tryptophanyl-tRNA synthetase